MSGDLFWGRMTPAERFAFRDAQAKAKEAAWVESSPTPTSRPLPHAGGPRVNPGSREVESPENTSNHGENPLHGEGEQS